VALLVAVSTWVVGVLVIESAGHPKQDTTTGFLYYDKDHFQFWMRLYHVFGGLWITQFIIACQHVTIAGAVSSWYFTR
jgi:solute carrier family 44 protein 1 (choline transporter-like protein)